MKPLPKEILDQLLSNGRANRDANGLLREDTIDHKPVVKLFTPDGAATWLLTEVDPEDPDEAFGLCDLGMGHPELGNVSLSELAAARGHLGLPIERDLYFVATKTLSEYAKEAAEKGRIAA